MMKNKMEALIGKTIVVTGATGLIGSYLVNTLLKVEGINVIALGRSEEKIRKCFAKYLDTPYFCYIVQDASLPIKEMDAPIDVIFHAAGSMAGDVIRNSPVDIIYPNLLGTINCLEYLKEQEKRLYVKGRAVIFSSITVYANNSDEDLRVSEEDTLYTYGLDVANVSYSESKRMVEVIAKSYVQQYGIDAVIARISSVYGPTYFKPNTAFYEFIQRAMEGQDIIVNNSGMAKRDNIYIEDTANALLCLCLNGKSGEAYNVSSGGDLGNFSAIDEMALIIRDIVNEKIHRGERELQVVYKSEAQRRAPGLLLDNSKLKGLGWNLKTDIISGIRETVEVYLSEL